MGDFANKLRKKVVHSVGVVGEIQFVSNGNHPFTGLYKGCDSALIRFSSGLPFQRDNKGKPLDPSAAVKCLRNDIDSGNLLVAADFEG